jgi:tRNA threonylcarbamoyladenosine biosynthesis protein TsaE
MKLTLVLDSLEQTDRLAELIGREADEGQFLALCGDLGAGKTTFSRALTQALGCKKLATSPTFAVLQHYEGGRLRVFHADLYRLGSEDEVYDLGWDEFLEEYSTGLMIVEWADKFPAVLPEDRLTVICSYGQDLEKRVFELEAQGARSGKLLEKIGEFWDI